MASIGSGLGGAVAVAAETVYGTFVPPTRTLEPRSAKLAERVHIEQGWGLANGRSVELGSRRTDVWQDAGGEIETEFLTTGMALLLANAMGSPATLAQVGTTTAYSGTFNYGVPDGQNYFSLQSLVPTTSGTQEPQNFHGCKITKAEFTIERTNLLMVTYTVDSQYVETTSAAVTPTEVTNSDVFSASGMSFKVGAYGSEAVVDGVRKFTLGIERSLDVSRIYLGNTHKDEPVTINWTKLTCTMDVDLLSTNYATLWQIYHTQTPLSVVANFVGPVITGTYNNELNLNLTNAYVDTNGTPELEGPDIVKATLNFTGLIDAANDSPLTAFLQTADTGF